MSVTTLHGFLMRTMYLCNEQAGQELTDRLRLVSIPAASCVTDKTV